MKIFKCPLCFRVREAEDNIIMYICHNCQEAMIELKKDKEIKLKCEYCDSINLTEFNPRNQECSEGQDCEYMAHEINNETCFSCAECGAYNWFCLNDGEYDDD